MVVVDGAGMTVYSLVAAVPLPGVTWPVGEEVRRSLVLDSLGEPQQHAGVVVPDAGHMGRAAVRRAKERAPG